MMMKVTGITKISGLQKSSYPHPLYGSASSSIITCLIQNQYHLLSPILKIINYLYCLLHQHTYICMCCTSCRKDLFDPMKMVTIRKHWNIRCRKLHMTRLLIKIKTTCRPLPCSMPTGMTLGRSASNIATSELLFRSVFL